MMNKDLESDIVWLYVSKLTFIVLKTEFMLVGTRQKIATSNNYLNVSILTVFRIILLKNVYETTCLGLKLMKI